MASTNELTRTQQMKSGAEIFHKTDFITAVPGGASSTGTIDLPPGFYMIRIWGTQTNAGTDATFALAGYVDAAQTAAFPISGGLHNAAAAATPITLTNTEDELTMSFYPVNSVLTDGIVFIPYGLKWTYTKNAATAINLSLSAMKVA